MAKRLMPSFALPSNPRNQQVEHRVPELAVVRPIAKLREVSGHPLLADVNVRRTHTRLEQPPKAFNTVRVERLSGSPVVPTPLLSGVLDGAVSVAVAG